jgi:hypothetical protein
MALRIGRRGDTSNGGQHEGEEKERTFKSRHGTLERTSKRWQ